MQYKQGLVDYLIVIDAERTLLANQLSLAQAVNLQMGASIRLIKAFGGGWAHNRASSKLWMKKLHVKQRERGYPEGQAIRVLPPCTIKDDFLEGLPWTTHRS